MNIRKLALDMLLDYELNGKYVNLSLSSHLADSLSAAERGQLTALLYTAVERKLTYDYYIASLGGRNIDDVDIYTKNVLRLGLCQILHMHSIPDFAATNETVKLARNKGEGAFVNGILRAAVRNKENMPLPSAQKNFKRYLSVKYSFPEEIVEFLWDTGFCEELLKSLNSEPETTVRVNALKKEELETTMEVSPIYSGARILKGTDIAENPDYQKGRIIPQDIAAMMAGLALSPKAGDTVIDMCAAPGGKTSHLAELMENEGKIYAFDIHPHKIEIIKKNAERMGISIIDARLGDGCKLQEEFLEKADKVLCDVPCSGLGIIRRKPDIKWNKDDIEELPEIQYGILQNAAKYLKVGGELVYSTCTILKRENEDVVMRFLEENENFELTEIELSGKLER